MEELMFSMHMLRPYGIGGVLLTQRSESGVLILKNEPRDYPCSGSIPGTTVKFCSGGSGFLVSTRQSLKIGSTFIPGLILTAAHVVCDTLTYQPSKKFFWVELENGKLCRAFFLKSYLADYPEKLVSRTTGCEYCLPGDVAVLVLTSEDDLSLNSYDLYIGDRPTEGNCFVSGYPERPPAIEYCCPQLTFDEELENKVERAFHGFDRIVYAEGEIASCHNLIEVSCSTTNGMSGSPVVFGSKAIGVYVGGPPLPGQRLLLILKKMIKEGKLQKAYNKRNKLLKFETFYTPKFFSKLIYDIEVCCFASKNELTCKKNLLIVMLNSTIFNCVEAYKDKEVFKTNTGISVFHPLFQDVARRIDLFQSIDQDFFHSIDDVRAYLNK